MNKIIFAFVMFVNLGAFAIQDFETVVTAQKFNSSSTIVIDKKEIEKSRAKNLTTMLASQANLSIAQSNFQPNSIYLRGGDSSHVLILVDGVPFYDAASVQRTINLNSLDLKSIQRIEVIKGSQSVLFGGQALSGVIKIETIPTEVKSTGQVLAQGGTQKNYLAATGGSVALDEHQMVVARASASGKENVSPVQGSSKVYPTRLATADLAYVYKNDELDFIIKGQTAFDQTEIPTTNYPSYLAADTNNFDTSTYQAGVMSLLKFKKSYLKPTLSLANQRTTRVYQQDVLSGGGSATKQDYVGDLFTARGEFLPVDESEVKVRMGASYAEEKLVYTDTDIVMSNEKASFEGIFIKSDVKISQPVLLEVGARTEFKKMKDQNQTYQIGLTVFDDWKLEYSTGLKQPSLFQLYSAYGNQNLQPEKSISASISYETNITPNLFWSITGFQTEFSNLIIISGSPQHYENVSKSKTIGAEAAAGFQIPDMGWTFNLAVGYQEPRDIDKGDWLVRRPLRTASFKVRKEFEKLGLGLEAIHNGERRDRTGSASYGTVNSYTYLNATAEYDFNKNWSVFTRVQNLTNSKYESSYGFFDEGTSVTAGFEYLF